MSYVGLSRDLPSFLADAEHARRLIALGFPAEGRRILAAHSAEPVAIEALAMLDEHRAGAAMLRLDDLAASYALA